MSVQTHNFPCLSPGTASSVCICPRVRFQARTWPFLKDGVMRIVVTAMTILMMTRTVVCHVLARCKALCLLFLRVRSHLISQVRIRVGMCCPILQMRKWRPAVTQ